MEQKFRAHLTSHGYSITKPRVNIFNIVSTHGPLTLKQLQDYAEPSVDRASVYRTVALFEALNIVSRLQIGWKYKIELSEDFSPHHHHITCQLCSKIITLKDSEEIENLITKLETEHRLKITHHTLEFIAVCNQCQQKQTTSN